MSSTKPNVTIIDAASPVPYFRKIKEAFQYYDLLVMLVYRDIRVRYAQTFFGMAWAFINPVVSVLLLYFVFGIVIKVDTNGVPPLLYTMTGICSWNYFSRVVGDAGGSIIGAQSLVKKVYFPRILIPLAKAISAILDLIIVLVILFIMLAAYQMSFRWQMLMIIPFSILTVFSGIAFGIWVASLTIRFRDFSHIVPLVLRIGMFVSPIAYGAALVPVEYRWAFNLNPLTGIIEGFKWAVLGTEFNSASLITSVIVISLVLIAGVWYFLRLDKYIADIV